MTLPMIPAARLDLVPGQRVLAKFKHGSAKLGVVSGERGCTGYPVQFTPCDAHWFCSELTPYGDANGWTDQEYRIEREKSYCESRARNVEDERRRRYPDAPFSAYREEI